MQSTLVEIVDLSCFYFVELVDLLIGFLGTLLGLFMQDYRFFVFFLACIFIVSAAFLIDQIRALGYDIVKWKKGGRKNKSKTSKTRKTKSKSPSSGRKSSATKSKSSKKTSSNGRKVVVKRNKNDGSAKIIIKKDITTPGVKNKKSKVKSSNRKGA